MSLRTIQRRSNTLKFGTQHGINPRVPVAQPTSALTLENKEWKRPPHLQPRLQTPLILVLGVKMEAGEERWELEHTDYCDGKQDVAHKAKTLLTVQWCLRNARLRTGVKLKLDEMQALEVKSTRVKLGIALSL
jgi:hypothetical protein